jgi:rhamnose utilization protein RhaD (predicted bifunctional aldolase and dehydrogenase)
MTERADLVELVGLCRAVGGDLGLVQAAGGNASIKAAGGSAMRIKASGARMREVSEAHGTVTVDAGAIRTLIRAAPPPGESATEADARYVRGIGAGASGAGRPSLESGFHALLDRVVLHTHALHAVAVGCLEDGATLVDGILAADCAWVRYRTPGIDLARELDGAVLRFRAAHGRSPALLLLEQHGLIATGADAAEVVAATARFVAAAAACLGPVDPRGFERIDPPAEVVDFARALAAALAAGPGPERGVARAARFGAVARAAEDPDRWLAAGPLVPDDVVHGVHAVHLVAPGQSPAAWLAARGAIEPSCVVVLAGHGVVLVAPTAALVDALDEVLLAHVLARRLAAGRGRLRTLAADAIATLSAMESERYRRERATAGEPCRS